MDDEQPGPSSSAPRPREPQDQMHQAELDTAELIYTKLLRYYLKPEIVPTSTPQPQINEALSINITKMRVYEYLCSQKADLMEMICNILVVDGRIRFACEYCSEMHETKVGLLQHKKAHRQHLLTRLPDNDASSSGSGYLAGESSSSIESSSSRTRLRLQQCAAAAGSASDTATSPSPSIVRTIPVPTSFNTPFPTVIRSSSTSKYYHPYHRKSDPSRMPPPFDFRAPPPRSPCSTRSLPSPLVASVPVSPSSDGSCVSMSSIPSRRSVSQLGSSTSPMTPSETIPTSTSTDLSTTSNISTTDATSTSGTTSKSLRTVISPQSLHPCLYCDKKFEHTLNLKKHVRGHLGDTAHKCSICYRCFSLASQLRLHKNSSHTGGGEVDKSPKCDCEMCGKSFTQDRLLIQHQREQHGEIPCSCEVLDEECKLHPKKVPKRGKFVCPRCRKAFFSQQLLDWHIEVPNLCTNLVFQDPKSSHSKDVL